MIHIMRSDPVFSQFRLMVFAVLLDLKKSVHVKSKRRSTSSHLFPSVKNEPFHLAAWRLLALLPVTLAPGSGGAHLVLTILL